MKIAIYDPYMHILGGAERYVLSIAACCNKEAEITVFTNQELLKKAAEKFNLQLNNITSRPWPTDRNERDTVLTSLDVLFYVTDGSIFRSPAKKNILIIQSSAHVPNLGLINRVKFRSWQKIICYSQFMAKIIADRIGKKAEILFVPVGDVDNITVKKKNMIISVGRFFSHLHSKKQKEMVGLFRQLITSGVKAELCLVGSVDDGGEAYLKEVQAETKGLPVTIVVNPTFDVLHTLYSQAKVYWHAAGYGEDLVKYPEKAEHFGVSTIEAMARGCAPVVFAAGGQEEIIEDGQTGFLWKNAQALLAVTTELLKNDTLRIKITENAEVESRKYSQKHFCQKLHEIIAA